MSVDLSSTLGREILQEYEIDETDQWRVGVRGFSCGLSLSRSSGLFHCP